MNDFAAIQGLFPENPLLLFIALRVKETNVMGSKENHSERTILIADDDEAVLQTFASWFSTRDTWDVELVTNGGDAVKALDEGIDVFLLDREMDELCGHQVLRRYDVGGYEFPVIVISGHNPNSYLHEDDVDLYLRKPLDRDSCLEAVEQALNQ